MTYPHYRSSDPEKLQDGNYIGQALDLLSEFHFIQGICLSFQAGDFNDPVKFNIFFASQEFPLLQRLMLIKGIQILEAESVVGEERKPVFDGHELVAFQKSRTEWPYHDPFANFLDARSSMTARRYMDFDDIVDSLQAKLTAA